MELYKKILLLQQDLLIKHYNKIDVEVLSKSLKSTDYNIEIFGNKIEIKKRKRIFTFGFLEFVKATGIIEESKINFIIQYDRLRQTQFLVITVIGLFIAITTHWIFFIPTLILYLSFQSSLIITRQEVIKIFERIWA